MKIFLFVLNTVLILVYSSHGWIGNHQTALSFQPENQMTSTSHALLLFPAANTTTITDFSLCLWFNVFYFRKSSSYICSYATSSKDNNEMNLGIRSSRIVLAAGSLYVDGFRRESLLLPGMWHHLCFVANGDRETGTFYLDKELTNEVPMSPRSILLNGSLVLGQETDVVAGSFQAQQSFSGLITGFNIFSRSLTTAEVMSLAACRSENLEGDVVSWNSASWVLSGSVKPLDLQEEDYCHQKRFRFVVFPKMMSPNAAIDMCASLKSELALPPQPH
ncbi:pentraxin-4-like [Scylla paramamosain]|uniref:pentraxin-4-like n=1 Tax=Scylla paramamosain TaxID=85552 RepID=UPI003082E709